MSAKEMTLMAKILDKKLYVLAALAGLLQAWSMGLPFHLGASGAMQWVGMLVLCFLVLGSKTGKECARVAFIFQTTALSTTFWWIFISLYVYGHMHGLLAAFAVVALASALAVYWWFFSWVFYRLCMAALPSQGALLSPMRKMGHTALVSMGFGAAWLLSELCRGQWFTGFPWGSSGYAHNDTWLSIFAPWVGVYGMGAISAAMAMWVAKTCVDLRRPWVQEPAHDGVEAVESQNLQSSFSSLSGSLRWRTWAWIALPLLSLVPWNSLRGQDQDAGMLLHSDGYSKPLSVELLQGNVPQQTKFRDDRVSAAQWYYDQIMLSDAQLVVTPETAFAMTIHELPSTFLDSFRQHLQAEQQAVLLGMPTKDGLDYANSALAMVGQREHVYRYDKSHLVPFGEFIPPLFQWFTNQMQMPLGFFKSGPSIQSSLRFLNQSIAPNICYEDLFGEELALQFKNADRSPSILVNMSNIAWFGDTVILDQHLEISRMRTLELRRPMIRSTNSGVSAIIDHTGRVNVMAHVFSREKIKAWVHGRFDEPTFFAWWASRYGLLPLWALALAVLGFIGLKRSFELNLNRSESKKLGN